MIWLDNDIFTKAGDVGGLAHSTSFIGNSAPDNGDRVINDESSEKLCYDADGT